MPPVARYTLRRLLLAAITVVGVVIAVFLMTHILPSDPAALRAGPLATEELIDQYRQEMGLDKHSLEADPLFKDPLNGDFTLDENSPAFKLGFEPIDVSKVGLLEKNVGPLLK